MSLYQTALQNFPSLKSFSYREQSLRSKNAGLGWQRLLDVDATTNYYHFSTVNLGLYTSGDFSILNTFDIFNKKGVERAIIRYEIQKNKSLTALEKKNIFTRLAEAYFTLLKNRQLLKIHTESLDWIEKNILLVNTGASRGIFPATEVSRWTIEKLNRQNSIYSDNLEISRSEETLETLTGLDSVTAEKTDLPEVEVVSEEDLLRHSPELAVYELDMNQLQMEILKEHRGLYPDLQVGNSLVRNREPASTGDQYLVSASLSFKLFDGGRRFRINSVKARIKSLESDQNAARAILTESFRNMLQELNTQREMLKNIETARGLSSDNLAKLVLGYQKRFVDFITVFNAFRDDIGLRENYEDISAEFAKNYQFLYHLASGDIYH